ncbi:MAG TPA: NRDE family protein [Streptosporangiaceae bacterium]|nr:NRDE family protein [Streptosporangiaceae bacterium]
MCTAVISFAPASPFPVLLAGVRDEFVARAWQPPGRHWPDRPALIGGRDAQAGGTWLAVDPGAPRVATVLNGRGKMAPERFRVSRGDLPLRAAAGRAGEARPADLDLTAYDPFHLLAAEPDAVRLWSWDGDDLTERSLGPGLHLIVNSGLEGSDLDDGQPGSAEMSARVAHFRRRFAAVARPQPGPGPPARAWGEWLPLAAGDGLDRTDPRALVVRRDFGDGRIWGTTSISLVALTRDGARFDFSPDPGAAPAWHTIVEPTDVR